MKALPMEAWCMCCDGTGEVPAAVYVSTPQKSELIYPGKMRQCPGCFGTKISARAKKWREDTGFVGAPAP